MKKSVIAIVFKGDEVLVLKRRDVPIWVLPGGGIDPGEEPETAAIREVNEETGITCAISRIIGEYYPINRLTYYTYLFECKLLEGSATVGSETAEVGFFPVNQLPQPFFHIHEEMIQEALKKSAPFKRPFSNITYFSFIKYFFNHPQRVVRILLSRLGLPINK